MYYTQAFAPTTLKDLFAVVNRAWPRAQLGGILEAPSADPFWGYHPAFAEVSTSDDSHIHALNNPPADRWAACAIDITLPPDLMKTATARLIEAAKVRDMRLRAVREFAGTLDGVHTTNYECLEHRQGINEWDKSHLYHVHLSIWRSMVLDHDAIMDIADVIINGGAHAPGTEEDMPKYLHLGMNKGQDIPARQWTPIVWDVEFADPDNTNGGGSSALHNLAGAYMSSSFSALVNESAVDPTTGQPLAQTVRSRVTFMKYIAGAPDTEVSSTMSLEHPITSGNTSIRDTLNYYVLDGTYVTVQVYVDVDTKIQTARIVSLYWKP